ncbi:MAG: amidohydrolase family protein, partial [Candidatus Binatia bacterium]
YNRWIAEFCRGSRGRLVPIAHLSLMDPEAAAKELERAVKDGCRGAFVTPRTHLSPDSKAHRPLGHSAHDPVFAMAQSLDVPLAIHVGNPFPWDANWFPTLKADVGAVEPTNREFDPRSPAAYFFDFNAVGIMHGTQRAFVSLFSHGTLEQFPKLRVGVLEAQAGWIGSFLDRLDSVWEHVCPAPGRGIPLTEKPSTVFRRQCFISADPDEISTAKIMDYVGDDRFMWASDYPHYDHPESWVPELQKLVDPLPAATRARILGDNAKAFYRL